MKKENIVLDSWIGDIIGLGKKEYIIIDVDFDCGGNTKLVYVVRQYKNWLPLLRFVKVIPDCDLQYYQFR